MTRPEPAGAPTERALRADAEQNRARVLQAARELFAEQGLDASANSIARRAGVGIATLLRRFPTRDDLIAAAFAEKMTAYTHAIDDALAAADPWQGFCTYIERVCQMQADDRGFADVLTMTFPTAKAFEEERNRSARALTELLERAKAAGQLRDDFAHQDLPLILMANAGVVTATRDAAPEAWRRLVGYLIQSFAAATAQTDAAAGRARMRQLANSPNPRAYSAVRFAPSQASAFWPAQVIER